MSLVSTMNGNAASDEAVAITTFGMNNHGLRTQDYRYIQYEDGLGELYNLNSDPEEWTNLFSDAAYADVINDHRKLLPTENVKWKEHPQYTFQPYFVEQKERTSK